MNTTVTGTIKQIFNSEIFGNFEKRVFWVEETGDTKYPNTYQLEMQQGECGRLDSFKAGDKVECSVDVRGRFYSKNGKDGVINTLKCWKLVKQGQQQNGYAANNNPATSTYTPAASYRNDLTDDGDQLPF